MNQDSTISRKVMHILNHIQLHYLLLSILLSGYTNWTGIGSFATMFNLTTMCLFIGERINLLILSMPCPPFASSAVRSVIIYVESHIVDLFSALTNPITQSTSRASNVTEFDIKSWVRPRPSLAPSFVQ